MPTLQEKVAQVEAALKSRFFPLVPKIENSDRTRWLDDQHEMDRLSRSLAAYAIVGISDVDDATAVAAVTDGKNDGGIDAVHFDQARNRIVLVQAKFKRSGTAPSQDEILKTINGIKALIHRRFNDFNASFQSRLGEIETALDTPGVVIELSLVYLGDNLGPHVTSDLNALGTELNTLGERVIWHDHGISKVLEWLVAEQTPSTVTADFTLEYWAAVTAPRKAVYGQISAASLALLVATHGKSLFQKNIRHYLGSVGVNSAIEETVRRRPGDFFYLNNGLTAVADKIQQSVGTNTRCNFRLENLSIVNGAQTAGAIANASAAGQISPDARILITIIEIGASQDDIGLRITKARNHQNVVRSVDFAALDPNQERLRRELAVVNVKYHYRPSAESRVRCDDAFTLEEAAVALACLSFTIRTAAEIAALRSRNQSATNAVDFVVTAKRELGRLWEQDGSLYPQLFSSALSGVRMCRLVQIHRFVDRILAGSEASEFSYFRRMFFRHGRYLIAALVAKRCSGVISGAAHMLSADDKTVLSRSTNQVAENLYTCSEPLQGNKGYLAIFRNLTDAQQLSELAMMRLVKEDSRDSNRTIAQGQTETLNQQGNVQ